MNKNEDNVNQSQTKAQIAVEYGSVEHSADDALIASAAADLIKTNAEQLDSVIAGHLMVSRNLAVSYLAQQQTQMVNHNGDVLQWLGSSFKHYFMQHRTMSAAFAMILVTFIAVQQFEFNDNLENSDAFLLASDLPPEAFADKGFDTWLVSARD